MMRRLVCGFAFAVAASVLASASACADFVFSTGDPDGRMAAASRPSSAGKIEIETGDDFVLGNHTLITSASFTGLLSPGIDLSQIGNVVVEIYRVFPLDSTVPPSGNVPTRVNSPSDVAFDSRDATASTLSFVGTSLNASFTAANSVLNGINPKPNQNTLGEGPVTGQEVRFDVKLTTPFDLAAGHYFFVPQVEVTGGQGDFFWLSAPKPIVAPGTPFTPDLQAWIRNENLAPDWLRIGTDIVGGQTPPTFNMSFSLAGQIVPEPSSVVMLGIASAAIVGFAVRHRAGTQSATH
jgi:hypothetical protein